MYIVECIDGESELYFYIVQIYRVIIIFLCTSTFEVLAHAC